MMDANSARLGGVKIVACFLANHLLISDSELDCINIVFILDNLTTIWRNEQQL